MEFAVENLSDVQGLVNRRILGLEGGWGVGRIRKERAAIGIASVGLKIRKLIMKMEVGLMVRFAEVPMDDMIEKNLLNFWGNDRGY